MSNQYRTDKQGRENEGKAIEFFTIILRFIGVLVLATGMYFGIQVITKAWELFEDSSPIVKLSDEIEAQSNVNAFINSMYKEGVTKLKSKQALILNADGTVVESPPTKPTVSDVKNVEPTEVKPSYFIAWFIAFLLILTVGRVACWFITAGGKLALFNPNKNKQLKKVIRQLALEMKSA